MVSGWDGGWGWAGGRDAGHLSRTEANDMDISNSVAPGPGIAEVWQFSGAWQWQVAAAGAPLAPSSLAAGPFQPYHLSLSLSLFHLSH